MKIKFFYCLTFILSTKVFGSTPPCSKWEFIVRTHEVQADEKQDGTKVTKAIKKIIVKTNSLKRKVGKTDLQMAELRHGLKKLNNLKTGLSLKKKLSLNT